MTAYGPGQLPESGPPEDGNPILVTVYPPQDLAHAWTGAPMPGITDNP